MKQTLAPTKTEGFYVIGGTLPGDAASYIARDADEQLFQLLKKGEVCYVLTARQMGKSSLMVQTAARLREEGATVAVLDLTALGQNLNEEEWYSGLLEIIGEQLKLEHELEHSWLRNQTLGCLQRWMIALREVVLQSSAGRVIIFIDEIDAVRSLRFSTDEFFAGIRQFYNHRTQDLALTRLTFCLMGVASPSDLIRDTRTTPFNIGRRIELSDFVESEAAPLAQGFGQTDRLGLRLLRRVLHWTGGHPYLTQRLCQAVADDSQVAGTRDVDRICTELFLSQRARERDDNLLFVRERLLRSEVDTPSLLTLYDKVRSGKKVVDDQANVLIAVLRLSGITRVDNGCLRVRNRVYDKVFDHQWVQSNMPGAELRRQRAAYVRGLKVIGLPALLVFAASSYIPFSIYRQSVAPPQASKTPAPPAFWASFSVSAAASNQGTLLINAGQPGVDVSINNRQYGRTNKKGDLLVPLLEARTYSVSVQKPGFQTLTQQVKIEAQKQTQLTVQLVQPVIAGSLATIDGIPSGAEVRLDGRLLGTTGNDGRFLLTPIPGEHTVQITKEGFLPQEIKEMFAPGKSVSRRVTLEPDVELQRWQTLLNDPTLSEIDRFVRDYPRGRFVQQALKLEEETEWNSLKGGKDLEALTAFVNKFPQGPHASDARNLMADPQAEQEAWLSARVSKDVAQLKAYLEKYPQGQYASAARDEIANLTTTQASVPVSAGVPLAQLAAEDKAAIQMTLSRYADAINRRKPKDLKEIWPAIPASKLAAVQRFVDGTRGVNLSLTPEKWEAHGTGILVTCHQLSSYERDGKKDTRADTITFYMVKTQGTWKISDIPVSAD